MKRWSKREDELLLIRAMLIDEAAEYLDRTPCELWARAAALGVDLEPPEHRSNGQTADHMPHVNGTQQPVPMVIAEVPIAEVPAELYPLSKMCLDRSPQAMAEDEAERVGRRVALALYRGSIEVAREALEDAWQSHAGEGPLPQGPTLLAEPLARVIPDVRLLNALETAGIETIQQLVTLGRGLLQDQQITNVGPAGCRRLLELIRELRVRAGLDTPETAAAPSPPPKKRPGPQKKAVPDQSPEMRRVCEEETVRLLPLIERIARASKLPLPIEDLIQEGAKACFETIPRYDPNQHANADGKPASLETFVAPRIRGAMLDYGRRSYFLSGGSRTGRADNVISLSHTACETDSHRQLQVADLVADESPEVGLALATRSAWRDVLKGFNKRERLLVLEYFVHGRTLRSIAEDFAVNESRCSQMLSAILARLKAIDQQTGGRVREALSS